VKPHASPVFHAANYLFGRQSVAKMEGLRQFGGAQAYPSRVKDGPEVDFSTGSVGLGVAITSFASLIQDYVRLHGLADETRPPGRHIAIAGDAELDEGNIYEALLEAGNTTFETFGGLWITTARAWIPLCRTGFLAG